MCFCNIGKPQVSEREALGTSVVGVLSGYSITAWQVEGVVMDGSFIIRSSEGHLAYKRSESLFKEVLKAFKFHTAGWNVKPSTVTATANLAT